MRKSLGAMYIQRLPRATPSSGVNPCDHKHTPGILLLSHSVIRMCACVQLVITLPVFLTVSLC
jgi:hypothetical protein